MMGDVVVLLFDMEWVESPRDEVYWAETFLKWPQPPPLLGLAIRKWSPPRGTHLLSRDILWHQQWFSQTPSGVSERGLWSPHRDVLPPPSTQLLTLLQILKWQEPRIGHVSGLGTEPEPSHVASQQCCELLRGHCGLMWSNTHSGHMVGEWVTLTLKA